MRLATAHLMGAALLFAGCSQAKQPPVFLSCDDSQTAFIVTISGNKISTNTTEYQVFETTDLIFRGREVGAPINEANTISINRVNQQVLLTNKISLSAAAVLDKYCDSIISQQECADEMGTVTNGNRFACFVEPVAGLEKRCPFRAKGDNIVSALGYQCRLSERAF